MAVLTISRKIGSDGDTIARTAAERLGYDFVDKELIGAVLGEYGLVEFDREYDHLPTFWEKFDIQREERRAVLADMLNRVLRAVAQRGNVVILGRSGYVVLAEFADVLHVRIQAPEAFRVGNTAVQANIPLEEAETIVQQDDKIRAAFVKTFYGVDWEATNAFDLTINRGKIAPELAVDWLVDAVRALEKREADDQPTTALIQVDANLAEAVSEEMA
jgi:cytidylate kinase